jgi:hypothetical protein
MVIITTNNYGLPLDYHFRCYGDWYIGVVVFENGKCFYREEII